MDHLEKEKGVGTEAGPKAKERTKEASNGIIMASRA